MSERDEFRKAVKTLSDDLAKIYAITMKDHPSRTDCLKLETAIQEVDGLLGKDPFACADPQIHDLGCSPQHFPPKKVRITWSRAEARGKGRVKHEPPRE